LAGVLKTVIMVLCQMGYGEKGETVEHCVFEMEPKHNFHTFCLMELHCKYDKTCYCLNVMGDSVHNPLKSVFFDCFRSSFAFSPYF
jgi:hypothetical protein